MFSDRSTMHRFLLENGAGPAENIRADLVLLEPFFRKADSAMYDVAIAGAVHPEGAASALSAATGALVERVIFLSLRHGPNPLRGEAAEAFWNDHARERSADLKSLLWRRHTGTLEAGLGAQSKVLEFHDLVWKSIGEPLWHSFEQNRWDSTGSSLRLIIRANLLEAIVHFAGFILLGEEERLATLRPLMRLLSATVPIGASRNDENTWECITA
ncbi:MAG TPA: hypothetical protein VL500_05275 [Candidatus Eisenbacteria bacterium]|jgi:hypothetical protein|nr:hypothetical protein [Candidatus Eisenbacteria bacterium]